MALGIKGQTGVQGVALTVGTNSDLAIGEKAAPGEVGPSITTAQELEHAAAGLSAWQSSFASGAAAMAAGDASNSSGTKNTLGGPAQQAAGAIMRQRTDMGKSAAAAAARGIIQSGNAQWQESTTKTANCAQNTGACH